MYVYGISYAPIYHNKRKWIGGAENEGNAGKNNFKRLKLLFKYDILVLESLERTE